jgi:hypothetical protein
VQSPLPPNQTSPAGSKKYIQTLSWFAILFFLLSIASSIYAVLAKQEMFVAILGCISTGLSLIFAFLQAFPSAKRHLHNSWRLGGLLMLALLCLSSIGINAFTFIKPGQTPLSTAKATSTSIIPTNSTPSPTTSPVIVLPHSSPTSSPIHLTACPISSADAGTVKFLTQNAGAICVTGVGTLSTIIDNVVQVKTGTTYATWIYTALSSGVSHHSPKNSPYNCPGRVAPYPGKNIIRVYEVTIALSSSSCSSQP